ncbi:MAG TPA: ABC transporter substrate-binding protein [Cyclobacteriaceae bacterium]|nr:ABC transporter substrate-binding protein [Cyclobacteriaceae bacterium]
MIKFQLLLKSITVVLIVNCQLSTVNCVQAQTNYDQQYAFAKRLYIDGKFSLAQESFKSLIPYSQGNPYSEYASFYYALSAYRQGFLAVSKDMFTQIKSLYPNWDKMDEVNLWLAKIHFDNKDYFQGLRMLAAIQNQKLLKETTPLKKQALAAVTDVQTLQMMLENYPDDEVIGEKLARELSKSPLSPEDEKFFEGLIQKFNLKKSDYVAETPASIHKDIYSVSILFPFVVNTLEPNINRKRNQFVLDLYEGMKLAADTLTKQGIKISLRAYDTERNPEKIKTILATPELKSTDLIVGPLFQEENDLVQEFSSTNQINVINPISNNSDLIKKNYYGFLYQPSYEVIGDRAAQFLINRDSTRKCMVFYGESKRDSAMAASFVKRASDNGLKILRAERVSKENSKKINDILATPTEFDEFKYPIQFKLPKDSLDYIFVASDDPLIYTKVISCVETRADSILIVGSENWLDQAAVDYEKYQTLNIVLAGPNFTATNNKWYKAFQKKFIQTHGRISSTAAYTNYAKLGYDFMLFIGNALKKHGVYFQEGLKKEKWTPGFLVEGYDFQSNRDNQNVPFIGFERGTLVVIEK